MKCCFYFKKKEEKIRYEKLVGFKDEENENEKLYEWVSTYDGMWRRSIRK